MPVEFPNRPVFSESEQLAVVSELPAWRRQLGNGALFAAWGNGDPILYSSMMHMGAYNGPTPTEIGTTTMRMVQFHLPVELALSAVHLCGVGATTGLYRFAIYVVGAGGARVWDSGAVNTPANAWNIITGGTPALSGGTVVLLKPQSYWFCVTATATGATAGFRSPPGPLGGGQWGGNSILPTKTNALNLPQLRQATLSAAGTFPATSPAQATAAWTTGSVPFAFLEGVAA